MATGAGALAPPVTLPTSSRRPGSAAFSDIYGGLGFGVTTASAGGEGAARAGDAARAGGAPITINGIGPDFLARPAGVLIVLLVLLVVWSLVDDG